MNLIEKIILNIIKHKVSGWFDMELTLPNMENSITADELSPERTWPDPSKIPSGREIEFSLKNIHKTGPLLKSCINENRKAILSLKDNPSSPELKIDSGFLEEFEKYAMTLGVGAIGYARLPRRLIFKDRAVLFDNAIVLLKEMDKDKIAKAPSHETLQMVFETYDSLGIAVNRLTEYLRMAGFSAQGGHPLGGLVLYPPLASLAGLGWLGHHGLLITPQFGARQRIGAIFTNIENLPQAEDNPYSWIDNFCTACMRCIRACPSKAIYKQPIVHKSGRKTHIDRGKCLPVFVDHHACSICIKVCPFSIKGYDDIYSQSYHS